MPVLWNQRRYRNFSIQLYQSRDAFMKKDLVIFIKEQGGLGAQQYRRCQLCAKSEVEGNAVMLQHRIERRGLW
ncbi:unnamed protein product [Caretta caretta]